jgi:hypothetical protein
MDEGLGQLISTGNVLWQEFVVSFQTAYLPTWDLRTGGGILFSGLTTVNADELVLNSATHASTTHQICNGKPTSRSDPTSEEKS